MAMAHSADFKTPMARLLYPQRLFKPRAPEEGQKPKYGCTLIFPKSDREFLEKFVRDTILLEWPTKGLEWAKSGVIKSPILAGDGNQAKYAPGHVREGELKPGMGAGLIFIRPNANEDRPPHVFWRDPKVPETEATVYSGCYGRAYMNAYAWKDKKGGLGVSFGLQGFQKHRDGERLGGSGGVDPEKWADKIEDDEAMTESGQGAAALFGG